MDGAGNIAPGYSVSSGIVQELEAWAVPLIVALALGVGLFVRRRYRTNY